ncbi:GNAT family N-acetyltransferase [Lachnoanaerobaculum gingivalis]|uniref:GNAT family N-acetyltransferase n=1 Tax=Lachnoanaerobaculum gingivalis TaxID=2490855 RepID=UPI0028D716E7|nr:GNAT family N-acetyltransferase [Lachnoanaerobaculum gingivalis]
MGSKFFDKLEEWAKENHLKRLELTVEVSNTIAINLYKRQGFVIEGTKKDTMLVDGVFLDEYMMAKIY